MTPTVKVLAFAGARDAIGAAEIEIELDAPVDAPSFLARICREHPALGPYASSLRLAINGTYAASDDLVRAGDEVAIIPPVSGG